MNQFLVTGVLIGAGIATVWHLLEHGSLALKASGHGHSGHSGHGKGKGGKVAGFDNELVGGVGIGVGLPLTGPDEVKFWAAHHGHGNVDQSTG